MITIHAGDILRLIVSILIGFFLLLVTFGTFFFVEKRVNLNKVKAKKNNLWLNVKIIQPYGRKCVLLEWTDPETGTDTIEYEIWRKTTKSKFGSTLKTHLQASKLRWYDDRKVTRGQTYFYCIHRPSGIDGSRGDDENWLYPESQTSEWVEINV